MARTIAPLEASKYPWKKWTDGTARRATHGTDFDCTPAGFRSSLYMYASAHGLRVKTSVDDGKPYVDFQFIRRKRKGAGQ